MVKTKHLKESAVALTLGLGFSFLINQQNPEAAEVKPVANQKVQPAKSPVATKEATNGLVAEGTWNTSKWELTQEGEAYTLHFHAGKLGAGAISGALPDNAIPYNAKVKVILDSGVVANEDSSNLFHFNVDQIEGLANLDVSQVTNMEGMFGYNYLKSVDLSQWDMSKVETAEAMFYGSWDLEEVNFGNWDNAKVNINGILAKNGNLCRITMGPKMTLKNEQNIYSYFYEGVQIPGTNKVATSRNWVALNGPDKDKVYTPRELVNSTRTETVTYEWDSTKNYPETKAVTRTINIHQPDGSVKTQSQTAMSSRQVKLSSDGSDQTTPWSKDTWSQVVLPHFDGYEPSQKQVEAQTIDGNTKDQTLDIFYDETLQKITIQYVYNNAVVGQQELSGYAGDEIRPHYRAPKNYKIAKAGPKTINVGTKDQMLQVAVVPQVMRTNETKTLTRTVNIHQPDGKVETTRQVVVLTRAVNVNLVTGEKKYHQWNTGIWESIEVPGIGSHKPNIDEVPEKQVTSSDTDQVVNIYYN